AVKALKEKLVEATNKRYLGRFASQRYISEVLETCEKEFLKAELEFLRSESKFNRAIARTRHYCQAEVIEPASPVETLQSPTSIHLTGLARKFYHFRFRWNDADAQRRSAVSFIIASAFF
ncbi:hypothetical protein RSAG8_13617, partial [Rhizoctonia solani AG-8 WAC10335]